MKRFVVIVWALLLAGCSADLTAKEPFPVEKNYEFQQQLVMGLQADQMQKLYSSNNKLSFYFVTTYEQAAFLKRNAPYLTTQTAEEPFQFSNMKLTLLDRFEIDKAVYYGLKVELEGTGKEWLDIPKSFSKLEVLLEQEPLFQFDVGTVVFREGGNAYVDTFSVDQLQPLAELLHERQK